MVLSPDYQFLDIANNYLGIPIGENTGMENGVYTFSTAGAFVMELMRDSITREELINRLAKEYDLDHDTAKHDVDQFLDIIQAYGLVVA